MKRIPLKLWQRVMIVAATSSLPLLAIACYLINVVDLHQAHVKPLADVRDDIEKTLRAAEQDRLQKEWIESLRKKTFIAYF